MTHEHVKFLYKHKVMYDNFQKAGVIPHLPNADTKVFLDIAKTFNTNYTANLWCGDCVMEMIDYVYKQAAKQPKAEAVESNVHELIAQVTAPAQNKNRRRR